MADEAKFNCGHMTTVGADGKARDMLVMPVGKLALWLATINANKVRPDLKAITMRLPGMSPGGGIFPARPPRKSG